MGGRVWVAVVRTGPCEGEDHGEEFITNIPIPKCARTSIFLSLEDLRTSMYNYKRNTKMA